MSARRPARSGPGPDPCNRCLCARQTNVYPSAQRRKLREFAGYRRVAVVIVTDEETLRERASTREAADGKEVPDPAALDMKGDRTGERRASRTFVFCFAIKMTSTVPLVVCALASEPVRTSDASNRFRPTVESVQSDGSYNHVTPRSELQPAGAVRVARRGGVRRAAGGGGARGGGGGAARGGGGGRGPGEARALPAPARPARQARPRQHRAPRAPPRPVRRAPRAQRYTLD